MNLLLVAQLLGSSRCHTQHPL
ncbi:hypothetical protein Ocin01_09249 [Orchesella cincta]|uniref:Uncharacterized protein n=1 Tax=Orchesella cincta TaxID=48709 RepID=A0A1D2MWU3_ORCCI|nr:hypothetical protein Ocin01_09249 [Orchesella cincta]